MPAVRFFFDAGSGTVLWTTDPADQEVWGYAVDLAALPVSQALRDELVRLVADHDTSLNWDYPPDPGPWREPRCRAFNSAVRAAITRLRAELGPDWRVRDEFTELHEDPDLDRYLADPAGFRRATADLRPATAADSEYCFQLHKATLGPHVTAVWGWDDQVQRAFHARVFAPDQWQIVTVDGAPVGMLHVEHRPTETYLARIEIHPDHQGRGIGSQLIRALLHQARQQGRDLVLDVLAVNQRALALYQRLGLREVARHGENDIKIRMSTVRPRPEP